MHQHFNNLFYTTVALYHAGENYNGASSNYHECCTCKIYMTLSVQNTEVVCL